MPGKKGANLGNKNNTKFKTSKERKKLCEAYCAHVRAGFSKESFPACDMQTFRRYQQEYPSDFDTKKIELSERYGRWHWEKIGYRIAVTNTGNATSWIFNMKNRFGWRDKLDLSGPDGGPLQIIASIENETRKIANAIPQRHNESAGAEPLPDGGRQAS